MIKKYSLSFITAELEQSYKKWLIGQHQYMYETTNLTFSIYLILNIVDSKESIYLLIVAAISLFIELSLLFFLKKYPLQRELIKSINLFIVGTFCYVLLNFDTDWNTGVEIGAIKLSVYLQGNVFFLQSLVFLSSHFIQIFYIEQNVLSILSYSLYGAFFVYTRYWLEKKRREFFMTSRSQHLYENLLEEQLPAWVVLVKFDKQQLQLRMDKISKQMRLQFNIQSDQHFREFLRDCNCKSIDNDKPLNLEQTLVKELQNKYQNNCNEKFIANYINNEKKWQFQINKIYFNTFQPYILLLFVEQGKMYDYLGLQLQWRDQQLLTQSKMCLNYVKNQISILKQFEKSVQQFPIIKQLLEEKIEYGYILFNQSVNILNITKIAYNQMKYQINEFLLKEFIQQLISDMHFNIKSKYNNIILKTDKSKLVSIILSLAEFIRLMISINLNDEKLVNQLNPNGIKIKIKFKRLLDNPGSMEIIMEHKQFSIGNELQNTLQKLSTFTDHKKRNWGVNHYYESIQELTQEIKSTNFSKQVTDSYQEYIENNDINQKDSFNIERSSQPFSTLGLPLAQYLISQIGPINQLQFEDKFNSLDDPISFRNTRRTKIKFRIYEDLNNFINELNQQDPNPYLDFFIQSNLKQKTFSALSPLQRKSGGTTMLLGSIKLAN